MDTNTSVGQNEQPLSDEDIRARQSGASPRCHVFAMSFSPGTREEWTGSPGFRRQLLACLPARSFVLRALKQKSKVRPARFWGEALVATAAPVEDGWYSSYKWLTSTSWTGRAKPQDAIERAFKKALSAYFPDLPVVQSVARAYAERYHVKPVAPDLWLLRDGRHSFIESKILPYDSISEAQLAGLAVIRMCWPTVNVSVVYLQEEGHFMRPVPDGVNGRFLAHCKRVVMVAGAKVPSASKAALKEALRLTTGPIRLRPVLSSKSVARRRRAVGQRVAEMKAFAKTLKKPSYIRWTSGGLPDTNRRRH